MAQLTEIAKHLEQLSYSRPVNNGRRSNNHQHSRLPPERAERRRPSPGGTFLPRQSSCPDSGNLPGNEPMR
jgi:hypothetical protein